ncbi:MAG: hypothetical protein JWL70_863 [Acidimicrobiia bacterium]|nr:hypothetical protein [Acidimicrobiia bacterium]
MLAPVVLVSIAPTGAPTVVGGRARALVLPAEAGVDRHNYLMPTALVRRLTVMEVLLGLHANKADSPGDMAEAKSDAWWAAVAATGTPLTVSAVAPFSPGQQAGVELGDIVTSVDDSTASAPRVEQDLAAGRPVSLRVLRRGAFLDLHVPAAERGSGLSFLALWGTPVAPFIDTGHTSGTSAGLLLALAEVDLLTPGDLTNGHKIAATGVVAPDGTISGVMAYQEKAAAAQRAGATVMLVAAADADAVRALAPAGLRVIGVTTVTHAVWELCALGGTSSVCGNAVG